MLLFCSYCLGQQCDKISLKYNCEIDTTNYKKTNIIEIESDCIASKYQRYVGYQLITNSEDAKFINVCKKDIDLNKYNIFIGGFFTSGCKSEIKCTLYKSLQTKQMILVVDAIEYGLCKPIRLGTCAFLVLKEDCNTLDEICLTTKKIN